MRLVFRTLLILTGWVFSAHAFASGSAEPLARASSLDPVTGIVAAGSTFKDLARRGAKADVNLIGSASLVRIGATGKTVVLTAAHVVSGREPWVEIDGRKRPVLTALYDNDADVAVMDVGEIQSAPAFVYEAISGTKQIKMTPQLLQKIDAGRASVVMLAYYLPAHALGFALRPWVDAGVETAKARGVLHAPVVSMNHDSSQIRIFTKVTSGASGSAVFDLREQTVAGLITQSHYYLSETYLAAASVLHSRLDLYNSGLRGRTSQTVWRMHNGLEYRIFAGGVEETNFTNRPTGGVIGQPGNGTIGQPGNGTIGQPGNGTIGQPGEAEDSEFHPWTESPQAVFRHFHVKPGLRSRGQSVLAYRAEAASSEISSEWPSSFTALAESESLRFQQEHAHEFRFTPLMASRELDLTQLLRERLGADRGARVEKKAVFGPSAVADDLETPPAPEECVLTVEGDQVKVRLKTYSHMNRATWKLEPDELEFSLNRAGGVGESAEFLPVVELRGKSGELYYVDLRNFYFADLSQVMKPMPDWSAENPPYDLQRFDRRFQINTIGLSVRNASSGAEFTYGFQR